MFNFIIILLIILLFGFIVILYKYINFLMYYFDNEIQILKKNGVSKSNNTPNTNYYCPNIFKSKSNECVYDKLSGKYKCAFKKWGLIFDSPPGCCENKCELKYTIEDNGTDRNEGNEDDELYEGNDNSEINDTIEEFTNHKYWCYQSNGKCNKKEYNPLNIAEMSCGTNMLNNQLSKIYKTEKECLNDYNECDEGDMSKCLSKSTCGWCADVKSGRCISGNPTEPNDMNITCNPYMYGEIK